MNSHNSIKHKKNLRDFRHAGSNSLVGAEPLALVDFVLVDFCYPEITLQRQQQHQQQRQQQPQHLQQQPQRHQQQPQQR